MDPHACTIIARNYLPAARVLAKSFREHHPTSQFTVLIVDDLSADVDASTEPFDVLRLDDIGIEHDEALRMAAIYDVTELCTAVKPWLLRTLLSAGATVAVYLDPDIKVFAPLEEVVTAAEGGIVLTPHVTRPMPRDGLSKSETEVLLSGIYNLGFIAVSEMADDFLSFWQVRLKRECIVDPEAMRFVDQRWVDFVPGLYPVHILRDTTYNVAYWNLDHRNLVFEGGRYFVDGAPLHFFHFSGYSPDVPYLLSKHQGHHPRILLSERPVVARICDEYRVDLLANGFGEGSEPEYGFKRLATGVVLDTPMRRLYRAALLAAERTGADLPPNPLEPASEDAFLEWITAPSEEQSRLSRYLKALYEQRLDVQRVFPDPEGAGFDGFSTWVSHEVKEGRLDVRLASLPTPDASTRARLDVARQLGRVRHRLEAVPVPGSGNDRVRLNMAGSVRQLERRISALPLPPGGERKRLNATRALGRLERRLAAVPVPGTGDERVRLNLSRWLSRLERRLTETSVTDGSGTGPVDQRTAGPVPDGGAPLSPGIRVAGYLRTESGVGELARLALSVAKAAGVATSTYVDTTALSRQNVEFETSGPDLNVNLVCVNADELPNFAQRVGPDFFRDHYTIGLWAWELDEFPAKFSTSFDYVDEVWVISDFERQSVSRASGKPVYAFPLPITEPKLDIQLSREQLGLPTGFIFLFCFDLLSIFERKNPLGLIEAFCKAFQPGEGPTLVIKVVNGQFESGSLERLKLAAAQRPDIVIIHKFLDPAVQTALMASCDCYVSLHRSEGFGLTLAEAMALGKPVIATGYSGNLDFMTPETSYLVPWSPGTVPVGCSPYRAGAQWAEPDLEAAARIMREVFEHPRHAKEVGERARGHVLSKHSVEDRARLLRDRFEAAQVTLDKMGLRSTEPGTMAVPGRCPSLVDIAQSKPALDAPSGHPRLARAFRRVVWRALRSHDDHDRSIHVHLATGVEGTLKELGQFGGQLSVQTSRLDRLEQWLKKVEPAIFGTQEVHARIEALEGNILTRVATVEDMLARQQTRWDSDHRLHDTLLRRLSAIERSVVPTERSALYGKTDVSVVAGEVREFLGIASGNDADVATIRIGDQEWEIPAWDTVILPWVREYGDWEPAVGGVLQEFARPGDIILDVGAHVGIFTVPLAASVGASGRVIAIEADPINARCLRRNVAKSHCDNVLVVEVAAAECTRTVTLSRSIEDNTGDSRAYEVAGLGTAVEVLGVALDDVVDGPVHLVKLDLQGMDHVAMRGMARIIREYRPVIVVEFWPAAIRDYGDDPTEVLAWFRELGYSWSAVEDTTLTDSMSDRDMCVAAEASSTGYYDLLLRPKG